MCVCRPLKIFCIITPVTRSFRFFFIVSCLHYFKLALEELTNHAMATANVMEMEQGLEMGSAVVIRDMKGSCVWTAVMVILVH